MPFVLSEMLIYSIMVYFLAGLTTEAAGIHFFLFLLCFWGARWVGIAFTQLCGTVFATIEAANGLQSAILTVFMLFCGFLISKGNIPSGWIWMYYLSFIRYPPDFLVAYVMWLVHAWDSKGSRQKIGQTPGGGQSSGRYVCYVAVSRQASDGIVGRVSRCGDLIGVVADP